MEGGQPNPWDQVSDGLTVLLGSGGAGAPSRHVLRRHAICSTSHFSNGGPKIDMPFQELKAYLGMPKVGKELFYIWRSLFLLSIPLLSKKRIEYKS